VIQPEEQPDRRGLAGPVGSEEPEHLTALHGETDIVDAPMPTEGGSARDRAEKNLKLYMRRLLTQGGGPGAPDERDLGDVSSIVQAL